MGNVLHRGKGSFTHVENTIFFDHGLSAKAKGIYCQIRSLEGNPEWVFTIKGFASLVRDGADAVTAGIKELEGCPVSYDVEAFHGLAPATSNRPMGGSSPEGRQMLPLEVVR